MNRNVVVIRDGKGRLKLAKYSPVDNTIILFGNDRVFKKDKSTVVATLGNEDHLCKRLVELSDAFEDGIYSE